MEDRGSLYVVSAPSGTGKTTLAQALVKRVPCLELSRSYTSRPPRSNEVDGVDYNFISRDTFEALRVAGEFLEWADVFGHLYGTRASDTQLTLSRGVDLVLVIDVQGAGQLRCSGDGVITIFVLPPSLEELYSRLRRRSGSELTKAELECRLTAARQEIKSFGDYHYVVVNDDLEECIDRLRCIILAERLSQRAVGSRVKAITETFREQG